MSEFVEFGTKTAANAIRDEYDEYLCPVDDDRRKKTVAFVSDTPEDVLERVQRDADDSRSEVGGGAGQAELTDREKDDLDFSETNVMHARAAKGVARSKGVDDWLSFYDSELSVDEHREIYERANEQERGRRLDAEESASEKAGRAARAAQSSECDHARGYCENGDADACEFLKHSCGYDEDEVESILDDDSEESEITGRAAGALGRAWSGYKAGVTRFGDEIEDALDAKRNTEQAAAAINAIRADHGQEPMTFERLEELSDQLVDEGRDAHDAQGHVESR